MTTVAEFPTSLFIDLPNWVGDTMMALPAAANLIAANRNGHTLINARPEMSRFINALFPQAAVLATEKKTSPFASARQIDQRFDIGITFRNAYRAKILLFLTARRRFGSQGQGARLLLNQLCETDRSRHQVHDPDPILHALGLVTGGPNPIRLPPELAAEGREIVHRSGLNGRALVGLAPASASAETKRWPTSYFGELANRLDGSGCDVWVTESEPEDPAAYAAGWLRMQGDSSDAEQARWLAYYDELGIEAFHGGIITLRKRSGGKNWFRLTAQPDRIEPGAGPIVLRVFDGIDFVERGEDALRSACLRKPDDLQLAPPAERMSSELRSGLVFQVHHDEPVAQLLAKCDGATPLADVCAAQAGRLGIDQEAVLKQMLPLARIMLEHGLLLPPTPPPTEA